MTALLLLRASAVGATVPAGYRTTATESSSTMAYGAETPEFTITVTVPPSDAGVGNYQRFVYLRVDGGRWVDLVGSLASPPRPTTTITVHGTPTTLLPLLPVGRHTLTPMYGSPVAGDILGPPLTLTVVKSTPTLFCEQLSGFVPHGGQFAVVPVFDGVPQPHGWKDGTLSVKFNGPQTLTESNLKPDGQGHVAATAPAVGGVYQATCSFSGTSQINAVVGQMSPVYVSEAGLPRPG
jgi:hypothetical protein